MPRHAGNPVNDRGNFKEEKTKRSEERGGKTVPEGEASFRSGKGMREEEEEFIIFNIYIGCSSLQKGNIGKKSSRSGSGRESS